MHPKPQGIHALRFDRPILGVRSNYMI